MHLDPQKSREAHPEIRTIVCVAASPIQPPALSPRSGMRDNQPASCRGDDAGQPFIGEAPRRARHVPPIPPEILQRIFDDDREFNRSAVARLSAPSWIEISIAALAVAALQIFLSFLDGGWLS